MAFTLGCTRWVAASIHFMLSLPGGTPLAVVLAGAAQLHWFSGRGAAASRHAVSVTQPLSAHTAGYCAGTQAPPDIQHDFHYIYRKWPVHERDDMSGWHLALVASPDEDDDYNAVDPEKASEWLFIDPDRADRFGHPGDTIIPGAGRKWSHLHRRQRSATFRDNSDSRAAPPSTGPPARVEEDDLNELPWQVIFLSKPEKVYAYRHEEAAHHRTVRLAVAVRIL